MVDLPHVVDVFRHFAGWADKIEGRWVTPRRSSGCRGRRTRSASRVGVVGAISAWNAPALIASWKLGPALAAGNAVVLKPAEDASLSTLWIAKLIEEVGFPGGVVNIVPGLGETAGAALVRHPGVDKLSFTGSPEVGREIAVQAARDFKKVTLELGGKSPQIVLGDANLEAVIPGLAQGFFGNQGEICAAGTRILVQRELYDDVVEGLGQAARAVQLGDPFDEGTQMGALINAKQRERVSPATSRRAPRRAPTLVAGGGTPDRKGFFVEPTVFAGGGNHLDDRPGGDLRARRARAPVRRAGGGDRDRQRHALRPRRLHLDDEPRRGPTASPRRSRPAACGSTAARRPTRACPGAA